MAEWGWIGAARTGVSHTRAGTRLQDAYSVRTGIGDRPVIAIAVSDGAGSAAYGGEGASLVCRTLSTGFGGHFASKCTLPAMEDMLEWVALSRERIALAAQRRAVEPCEFAATLVFAVSDGARSLFVHVGDGGVGAQRVDDGAWFCPTWPNQGEYASTTYFVTDEAGPRIRACEVNWPVQCLMVFSDGLERLALDFAAQTPYTPFFTTMSQALLGRETTGKDRELSRHLNCFLDSERINERTDDDKTLVVAALR